MRGLQGLVLGIVMACVVPRSFVGEKVAGFGSGSTAPAAPAAPDSADRPRNVILMIGDGMGLSQITAARVGRGAPLHLERLPVVGLQQTWSADGLVTDSAASATAMACGVKTNNGMIGMTPEGAEVPSVLHQAENMGWATGVIATSRITHATPASFVAHHPDRNDEEAIALDYLDVELELLIGGGEDKFRDRRDHRDVLGELEAGGMRVVRSVAEVQGGGRVAAFLADRALPAVRKEGASTLADATGAALAFLESDERGFFLMIEGSQIDWGGHLNHTPWMVTEAIAFDDAVGRALDYAEQHGDTLVVVTADHETGGFALKKGSLEDGRVKGRYVSHYHTATMVPVFAYGPGAELFAGTYDNTAIHDRIAAAMRP